MVEAFLTKELAKTRDQARGTQDKYNTLDQSIKYTIKKYAKNDQEIKTNDKLSVETRQLIKRRKDIKQKAQKSKADKIEMVEINKLVKKGIRKDLRIYNEEIICNSLADSWSTKKLRKTLSPIKI